MGNGGNGRGGAKRSKQAQGPQDLAAAGGAEEAGRSAGGAGALQEGEACEEPAAMAVSGAQVSIRSPGLDPGAPDSDEVPDSEEDQDRPQSPLTTSRQSSKTSSPTQTSQSSRTTESTIAFSSTAGSVVYGNSPPNSQQSTTPPTVSRSVSTILSRSNSINMGGGRANDTTVAEDSMDLDRGDSDDDVNWQALHSQINELVEAQVSRYFTESESASNTYESVGQIEPKPSEVCHMTTMAMVRCVAFPPEPLPCDTGFILQTSRCNIRLTHVLCDAYKQERVQQTIFGLDRFHMLATSLSATSLGVDAVKDMARAALEVSWCDHVSTHDECWCIHGKSSVWRA